MYRPEGWENPHKLTDMVYDPETQMLTRDIHDAYEAGADTMQQAVIEFLEQEILGHAQFLGYWLIPKKHWNKLKGLT